ncbi:MAG: sugar ABC transporter substrate-binding protein [Anaerolineae bacterium]|nr:sugar ABC transporter substrate-binding protein [Anaerolineae bacterium]
MLIKKQYVILLLIVVLSALTLPTQAQGQSATIPAGKCAAPGKLTMWVWDTNWQAIIAKSIDTWKSKYCAGAEVDLIQQPWDKYWELLKTSATSGDLPDVFNMSQDRFYFYAKNNALLDLQPYWDKAGIKTTVWGAGLVNPYRWGDQGDLYAGPVNWDTVAIYYNKDMFDAAKVAYPTAKWTWDDFAKAAQALTDPAKDVYGALTYLEYQGGYPNWIASTGTTPVVDAKRSTCTLTEPGSLEALNFLKGLQDKGYMPKVSIVGGSSATDAFNFFVAGKVAMITGGSWSLPDAVSKVKFNWDVVQIPRNPTSGKSRAILHAVGYVASAKSKNPELAANLIQFLVSDEGQRFFAEGGSVAPANPSPELQKLWINSFKTDKNIQAFVDATVDSQGVTVFDEIWDKINTELVVNIFDLGKSVDETTKSACDFINQQIAATK